MLKMTIPDTISGNKTAALLGVKPLVASMYAKIARKKARFVMIKSNKAAKVFFFCFTA